MSVDNALEKYERGEISTGELLSLLTTFADTPLSEMQKGLWVAQRMAPESSGYNVPLCIRLQQCDHHKLKAALTALVEQFPILNSRIEEKTQALFLVNRQEKLAIKETDVAGLPEHERINLIREQALRCFDLQSEPLTRLQIFSDGEDVHLLITVHHIIVDSHSATLLMSYLLRFYHALVKGRELAIDYTLAPYSDFVAAEKALLTEDTYQADDQFWQGKLSNLMPSDNLPQNSERQVQPTSSGKFTAFALSTDLRDAITHYCAENQATPAAFYLTAFVVLLFRYSGQTDMTTGVPFSVRGEAKFDNTVGHFINMLPIRHQLNGEYTFTETLLQVNKAIFQGIDHGNFPFSHMVKNVQGESRNSLYPLFSVTFNYQSTALAQGIQGVVTEYAQHFPCALIDEIYQVGEYPLSLDVTPENRFVIKYDANRYNVCFIESMARHYQKLLESVVASPQTALADIDYLTHDEKIRFLDTWNHTARKWPENKSLYDLFNEQAKHQPDAPAICFKDEKLTYRALNLRVASLAVCLQQQGIGPGDRVGIYVERSAEMVVALLGVLGSGATYVPLDPAHPEERVCYVLNDAECQVIVTQRKLKARVEKICSSDIITIYVEEAAVNKSALKKLKRINQPCCYILYTSGSTGNPKGVMIRQAAVINTLLSVQEWVGFQRDHTLLALTTYCFDISAIELFLPLISGACCVIADDATTRDASRLVETIAELKPDFVPGTPATFTLMFKLNWKNQEKVKIICAGEPISNYLKEKFDRYSCEVWNFYGPTETTIYSTGTKLKPGVAVNIGKPIANTQVYIFDNNQKPVAQGITGELYIGGQGVALGYWKRDDLTQAKFIDHPFAEGERLYRTGDRVRWLATGELDLIGRADNQVKIRGYRVELGEIESRLSQHPDVENCVVLCRHDGAAATLAAFYIAKGQKPTVPSLREYLNRHLPAYMIPDAWHEIADFPLTPNGKVDRQALARQADKRAHGVTPVSSPATSPDFSGPLRTLFAEVLGYSGFSSQAAFFDIGGDSFKAVELISRLNKRFNLNEKVTLIFQYPSVETLSRYLRSDHPDMACHHEQDSMPTPGRTPELAADCSDQQARYSGCFAIVGLSCRVPGAQDHREFWENICAGKESIELLTSEQLRQYGITEAMMADPNFIAQRATIQDKDRFDAAFFHLSPRDAEVMDPQARLLLQQSWLAIEDAGYNPHDIPDTAVYASASNNFYQALWSQFVTNMTQQRLLQDTEEYNAWIFAQGGTIPGLISHRMGFTGPSMFVNTNCSSSLSASYLACQSLAAGDCDFALVGAASLLPATTLGYVYQPGLNFSADGHCKAFADNADGMTGGEGVAAVLLRRAEDALRDGDNIYAMIRAIAVNNDGADKVGFYAPGINGQRSAIQQAIRKAKINPEDIRFVEAHGTGTRLGDPIEVAALTAAWRDYTSATRYCAIGSVKTNVGHLDTAAGLVGLIKSALALKHGVLPPSLNIESENRDIDFSNSPFYVAKRKETLIKNAQQPLLAAISAFGIGGSNVHAILQQAERLTPPATPSTPAGYLFVLSAQNQERLQQLARNMADFLRRYPEVSLPDMAYTLQCGRKAMPCRLAMVVSDINNLSAKLSAYLSGDQHDQTILSGTIKTVSDSVLGLFMSAGDIQQRLSQWKAAGEPGKIAHAWVEGVDIDWRALNAGEQYQRISLPGYAFAQQRFWLDADAAPPQSPLAAAPPRPEPAVTPTATGSPHQVAAIIRHALCQLLKLDATQLDDDVSFSDYGLNSLSAVKLISQINAAMQLAIDVTRIFDYPTVRRLAEYIVQTSGAPLATPLPTPENKHEASPILPATQIAERPMTTAPPLPTAQEPVAVIGMAGRFPQSDDIESFWQHIANGDDLVETVKRWDLSALNVQCNQGSFINDPGGFDPLFFNISGIEALNMEPQQRIFLEVAWHALEDAGHAGAKLNTQRCGVYVGCAAGDYLNLNSENPYPAQALWGNMSAVVPARVAYFLNLKGPAVAIDTACSSSLVAVDHACKALWNGDVDVALAGGIYLQCSPRLYQAGSNAGMLSPSGRCKTFDEQADGFVPAEGAAALVLKKLSQAQADGDRIYGVIRGVGVNQDGASNGISAPSANSQYALLQEIYNKYEIDVEAIQLVEAHGTGTPLGDPIEYQALLKAFAEKTGKTGYCALGSSKSNMGHAQMAAGVIGMVKVLMAMKYQQLPPTIHCQQTNSKIVLEGSPFYINKTLRAWPVAAGQRRCAVVSSFGVGGTNAHVVLEDVASPVTVSSPPQGHCLLVSARSPEQLRQQIVQLRDHLTRHATLNLRDVAYTLWAGRRHFTQRAFLVADSIATAVEALACWLEQPQEIPAAFSTLAQDYLQGKAIDLSAHFASSPAYHVSLPLYPFTHEHYWLDEQNSALFYTGAPGPASGSLPELKVCSSLAEPGGACYALTLTGKEFFLKDHLVQGKSILPGSVYFELARKAFHACGTEDTGSLALQNVTFLAPLQQRNDAITVMITIGAPGKEKRRSFEIFTDEDEKRTTHCRGEISVHCATPEAIDIVAIQQRARPGHEEQMRFYQEFAQLGIDYGPAFRGVVRAWKQPGAALVQLVLPETVRNTLQDFQLHPVLADCAMQSMKCLVTPGEPEQSQLLFAINELRLCQPCEAEMWVWIRYGKNKNGEFIRTKYDADLLNRQGEVCARFSGITTRTIAPVAQSPAYPPVCLLPACERLDVPLDNSGSKTQGKTLFLGNDSATLEHLASEMREAEICPLSAGETSDHLAARFAAMDTFSHVVWIAPAPGAVGSGEQMIEQQDSGIYNLFAIYKSLLACGYAQRPLSWTVILQGTHALFAGDNADPTHAGVSGFIGSLAKEVPEWQIRCVDVDCLNADMFNATLQLPPDRLGNTLLLRRGAWYQQTLIPLSGELTPAAERPLRQSGVVVIAGGAGGLGSALSEMLIRQFDAQVIWLGRRAIDARIQRKIQQQAKWGKAPHYVQVDVMDSVALKAACANITAQFGPVNGVVQSAMVLSPASLDKMTRQQFNAAWQAKMDVSVRLVEAFANPALELVLFLSTINSYMKAMGQSNYSAGCTFKDALAGYLAKTRPYNVKVINLGYCFNNIEDDEGNVDTAQLMHFIERDEFQQILNAFICSGINQMSVMKFSPKWSTLGMLFAKETFLHAQKTLPSFISHLAQPAANFDIARHDVEVNNALDAQNALIITNQEEAL
ncbi:amino acid adenylation domain-containing protein [Pantoea alhagi]|uniref:amino acid adenylation domain-containing protein n=1 Tax=Mixta sp. BE291 TaxID=3158787 RepID=UPI00285DC8A7|nr:amino acid adenylation domain-containing protein [Pantoea alhagi]